MMAVGGEDVLRLGGVGNPNPVVLTDAQLLSRPTDEELDPIVSEIFDLIRDIKDPEHPHTLEELNVVQESHISVQQVPRPDHPLDPANKTSSGSANPISEEDSELWIKIDFTPTVPHCSLATLIGLCLRVKLERNMQQKFKLDICVTEGMHSIEADVNKQINDKERVAAAMENPSLRDMVEECIREPEY